MMSKSQSQSYGVSRPVVSFLETHFAQSYPKQDINNFLSYLQYTSALLVYVSISKDKKVILSRENYLEHQLFQDFEGKAITEANQTDFKIFEMLQNQIPKPTLSNLIEEIGNYKTEKDITKNTPYRIGINSSPLTDTIFHPKPEEYANLVLEEIEKNKIQENVIIHSADKRVLQYIKKLGKKIRTALYVQEFDEANANYNFSKDINDLGFIPDIYSPHCSLVTLNLINFGDLNNMAILPWGVDNFTPKTAQQKSKFGDKGYNWDCKKQLFFMGIHGWITNGGGSSTSGYLESRRSSIRAAMSRGNYHF
jgi:glycerophosphoryl diester phosphodiesterase